MEFQGTVGDKERGFRERDAEQNRLDHLRDDYYKLVIHPGCWDDEVDYDSGGGADADAIHDNVASEISAITEKASPVSADLLVIEDSAAANVKKRVQIGNLPAGSEVNDLSASVTWANVPDANVTESSVTQHEAAIDHDALTNHVAGQHRIINDVGTSATELWSASKINTELGTKAASSHTHLEADITDLGSYIEASGVTYENLDANSDVGTGAGQVAIGNHTHGDLHTRSHAMTGASDHTAGNHKVFYSDGSGDVQELTHGTSTHVLTSNGATSAPSWQAAAGGGGTPDLAPGRFSLSGSQDLTTTEATIVWDTEDFDPSTNYANSSGEITVTDAGYYQVSANFPVNADGTGGATRCAVRFWLQQDQGTSTWISAGLFSQDYHRESSGGSGNSFSGLVNLAAGEVIRVRHDNTANTDVSLESGESAISIFKVPAG